MKILIPDSVPLDDLDLPAEAQCVAYDVRENIPDEHTDAEVLVVFDSGRKVLADAAARLSNLSLVQTLTAGTDAVEGAGFADDVTICSGVGLHDVTVAEHAMAMALYLIRRFPRMLEAQSESRWASELGGTQPLYPEDAPITTLLDANVLIWGFGSIAQHLAPMLQAFGAKVRGVARSSGERAGFEVITEERLAEELPSTDLLIMVLPSTPDTDKALDAERLEQLSRHAYVVNVGRGSTVDEEALVEALREGRIAGAALDVASREPLPSDSPLWEAPHLFITPHAAGGRPVRPAGLVSRNVAALVEGGTFTNRIDR